MVKLGIIVALLLTVGLVFGEISPDSSPAPSPDLGADAADSPLVHAPKPETGSPPPVSPSPADSPIDHSSPPEPESEHSPSPAPANSPSSSPPMPESSSDPSPSPEPSEASDVSHSEITATDGAKSSGSGGMSGGKKAGIVVGVFAAVCVVGTAGVVYKKRQENIRRSRYGYAARELL